MCVVALDLMLWPSVRPAVRDRVADPNKSVQSQQMPTMRQMSSGQAISVQQQQFIMLAKQRKSPTYTHTHIDTHSNRPFDLVI